MRPDHDKSPSPAAGLDAFADQLRRSLPTPAQIAERSRLRIRRQRALAACAGVAVLAAAWLIDPSIDRMTLATAASAQTWELPDGSSVTLNRDSRAVVDMHLHSRRVHLQAGQAYVDVSHSLWRSFDVLTPRARIEDIGTVFDVRVMEQGTRVTVVQGAVRVHGDQRTLDLHTDQTVLVDAAGDSGPTPIKAAYAAAWSHGKLIFDGTPLEAVAAELTRYGAPRIVFADKPSAGIALSGQFDIAQAATLVDLLPKIAAVRVSRRGDGVVVISSQ
ncbi:FecR family protein [Bordetella sp. N]|uniref:FecR family protein n=1 Tax=Bordetella sp. N TaxID=1746199 RepID=UPI00070B8D64|nr:FecR domain-containing protein [Bordetella sp. N]ALM82129.1 hypothetical protein ASB57_03370 [Bordetella sp. N]